MIEPRNISVTLYRKKDELKKGEEWVVNENVVEIPNYGRCDYAFFYHIVKNYEHLDDFTIFSKINWQEQGIPMAHLLQNVTDYDFILVGTHRKYTVWSEMTEEIRAQIPAHTYPHDIENQYYGTHSFGECCIDWYREIFPNPSIAPMIPNYGHGPVFSVSKELIRRHPKEVYEKMLNKFYPESGSWDTDYQKYGFSSLKEQTTDIGKHYHDNFIRLYPVLFTFQADPSFRILLT
jgi:hypothetical protein